MLENVKKYETFYGITAITVISPLLEFDVFFLFVPFLIRFFPGLHFQFFLLLQSPDVQ